MSVIGVVDRIVGEFSCRSSRLSVHVVVCENILLKVMYRLVVLVLIEWKTQFAKLYCDLILYN